MYTFLCAAFMRRLSPCLLFMMPLCISAQDFEPDYITYYGQTVPVTPNAATFTVYGNTPVNHATGVPQINIPLFTIEEDGLTLPISLSYHASGIKVDQLSGVVGLGWTLHAGGGIFRQVNGIVDEDGWLIPSKRGRVTPQWLNQHPLSSRQTQDEIAISSWADDYQPDDFNFHFAGYSGDFVFDTNGQITQEFAAPLYFSTIPTGVTNRFHFKARDGVGNTFYFDKDKEFNVTHTAVVTGTSLNDIPRSSNVSGWMLDSITTRNNKKIHFSHSPYNLNYTLTGIAHSLIRTIGCDPSINTSPCGCMDLGVGITGYRTVESTTSVTYTPINQLLTQIESPTVRVTFTYADDATLATWQRRLTRITILDKLANKTKHFDFTYGKFGGDPRLRLDQVQETGFDGTVRPPYRFYYEAGNLPPKGSTAKDFAGYYNGRTGNQTLVPHSLAAYNTLATGDRQRLANRKENLSSLKTGTLNRIEYPTGGSTRFTYEANEVPATGAVNTTFLPQGRTVSTGQHNTSSQQGSYTRFITYFRIMEDFTPVSYQSFSDICDFNNSIDCSRFNIYPATFNNGSYLVQLGSPRFSPFLVIGAQGSDTLNEGYYAVVLDVETADLTANPNANIGINLNWVGPDPNPTFYTGGLRVKTITDTDENQQPVKTTEYAYQGLNGYAPDAGTFIKGYGQVNVRSVFSSQNTWQDPALIKAGHYYDSVTVAVTDGSGTELKTLETYTDSFKNKGYRPVMTAQHHYRGNDKVQSVFMEYQNTIAQQLQFYVLDDTDFCYNLTTVGPQVLGYSGVSSYLYNARKHLLTQKTQVDYFPEPSAPFSALVTRYTYTYDNDTRLIRQVKDNRYYAQSEQDIIQNTLTLHPQGDLLEVAFTYPSDHQGQDPSITTLLNKQLRNLPVSKKVYRHQRLLQGQYMLYDANGNVTETYRYHKGQGSNTAGGYLPSDYERYGRYVIGTHGRPEELQRYDDIPTALLWDSTGTYLLAELQGVTRAQLAGIQSQPVNLALTTNAQLLTLFGNLRTAFPDAMITTYTHAPLLGVSRTADTRGEALQYTYDGLGRLRQIQDANMHLMETYEYRYFQQQP